MFAKPGHLHFQYVNRILRGAKLKDAGDLSKLIRLLQGVDKVPQTIANPHKLYRVQAGMLSHELEAARIKVRNEGPTSTIVSTPAFLSTSAINYANNPYLASGTAKLILEDAVEVTNLIRKHRFVHFSQGLDATDPHSGKSFRETPNGKNRKKLLDRVRKAVVASGVFDWPTPLKPHLSSCL
eukprot:g950.t1